MSFWRTRAVRPALTSAFCGFLIGIAGCAPPPPEDVPIVEEEVLAPPDAMVDPTDDETATYRSGVVQLPSDFPDLPLPRGTTVLDQEVHGTRAIVTLLVPATVDAVRDDLGESLTGSGWTGAQRLDEGKNEYRKGELWIVVEATADGPSTRLTIDY